MNLSAARRSKRLQRAVAQECRVTNGRPPTYSTMALAREVIERDRRRDNGFVNQESRL